MIGPAHTTTHRHRRKAIAAGAGALLLTSFGALRSEANAPNMSVSPNPAVAGSTVTVSGHCDVASRNTTVNASLFRIDTKPAGSKTSGPASLRDGSYHLRLALPAGLRSGSYVVEAACAGGTVPTQTGAPFTVRARSYGPSVTRDHTVLTGSYRVPAVPAKPAHTGSHFTG